MSLLQMCHLWQSQYINPALCETPKLTPLEDEKPKAKPKAKAAAKKEESEEGSAEAE